LVFLTLAGVAAANQTKAAYIRKADQLCKAGNAALVPVSDKLRHVDMNTASGIAQAVKLMGQAFKIENSAYSKLEALQQPRNYKAVLTHLWAALGTEVADTRKLIDALDRLDSGAISRDEGAINLAKASYKGLAQGFGFHYCGTH
jgi:hypothetical protein